MKNILIVEDDLTIREATAEFLREMDYGVFTAETGEEGIEIWKENEINLLILDIMLPGMSGLDMLKKIRAESTVPVIILTALSDEQTQIRLFDEYADDYLTKPFSLMILKKRIDAQLRHYYGSKEYFEYGRAAVDLKGYKAYYDKKEVKLTAKEFQVLEFLVENSGITFSREQMLNSIWSYNEEPYERVIDVYIKNIRHKLGMDCIKTVKGMGYRLDK